MVAKYTFHGAFRSGFSVTIFARCVVTLLIMYTCACRRSAETPSVDGTPHGADASLSWKGTLSREDAAGTSEVAPSSSSAASRKGACPTEPGAPSVKSRSESFTIFVSVDRSRMISTATDDVPYQNLCISRAGSPPEVLLEGRGAEGETPPDQILASFDHLALSADEKSLFFSSSAWVTSACIHRLDLETKKDVSLGDGEPIRVLETGPYKGALLALHFRLDPVHAVESPKYRGRMEIWTLLTQDGKTLRTLPENEKAREKLLAGWRATSDRNTDPKGNSK